MTEPCEHATALAKDRAELVDACARIGLTLNPDLPGAMTAAEVVDYLGQCLDVERRKAASAIEEARQWKARIRVVPEK